MDRRRIDVLMHFRWGREVGRGHDRAGRELRLLLLLRMLLLMLVRRWWEWRRQRRRLLSSDGYLVHEWVSAATSMLWLHRRTAAGTVITSCRRLGQSVCCQQSMRHHRRSLRGCMRRGPSCSVRLPLSLLLFYRSCRVLVAALPVVRELVVRHDPDRIGVVCRNKS